jgi:hypothetical protein
MAGLGPAIHAFLSLAMTSTSRAASIIPIYMMQFRAATMRYGLFLEYMRDQP